MTDETPTFGTREHAEFWTQARHPAVRDALQWLTFSHLPEALQNYSRPFYQAAVELVTTMKDSPELTHALTGLIGAKDWAVRAGIRTDTGRAGSVPRPKTVVNPPLFADDGSRATDPRSAGQLGHQVIPRPLERD
jgi:hypothetical protein